MAITAPSASGYTAPPAVETNPEATEAAGQQSAPAQDAAAVLPDGTPVAPNSTLESLATINPGIGPLLSATTQSQSTQANNSPAAAGGVGKKEVSGTSSDEPIKKEVSGKDTNVASQAEPGSAEDMEQQLRDAGLLTGKTTALYAQWLENAAERGVSTQEILKIAREQGITPEDFAVLENLPVYHDPDGKSFFQLPPNISAEDARKAVLMTYIFNAGTDYGAADKPANYRYDKTPTSNDFQETPYSSAEISRIKARQAANSWSYSQDVAFVSGNGGRLVTTPNGMLMGLGGNWLQGLYSQQGGTTYGDIFMVNIDNPTNPQTVLKNIVEGGSAPITQDPNGATNNWLDLDRLLHHEEMHSEQWASKGYGGFLASYAWDLLTNGGMTAEQGAGLHDGGYQ
jgi:hypothetical protein